MSQFSQSNSSSEEWRKIEGYEDRYEVSNQGRIRALDFGRTGKIGIRRPTKNTKNGYLYVTFIDNRIARTFSIHTLVARAFIGAAPDGMEVNHKNKIKEDNRADNLEYVTRSQNQLHSYKIGRWRNRGSLSSRSKINESDVREIRTLLEFGADRGEIAAQFGLQRVTISGIKTKRNWFHVQDLEPGGIF